MNWFDENAEWLVPIIIVVVMMACIIGGDVLWQSSACTQKAEEIGVNHHWGILEGCMIEIDNTWIPLENWRYFEGE